MLIRSVFAKVLTIPAGAMRVVSHVAGGASPLLTDLIAYYKLDEASGTRDDAHGPHNASDVNGVTSVTGKIGDAASFTGTSSQRLSVTDHVDLRGGARDFTFDGWLQLPNVSGTKGLLAKGSTTSGASHEYSMYMNGANLQWRMSAGATIATLLVGTLTAGPWFYFAVWYVASTGTLWGQINNNAAVSLALVGTPNTTSTAMLLGALQGPAAFHTGYLDEVGRWNRVLTGSERLSRYNGGSGLPYPFDGAVGGVAVIGGSFTYTSSIEA